MVLIKPEIELRHLRYFAVLAEEGHFGRAAQRLGIAQPALSQQIRRLEEITECTLLERRPRVTLTPAGAVLRETARRALAQIEQGLETTLRAGRGEVGTLCVGFAASAMLSGLPEVIRLYRERFPEVCLQLRELSPAAEVEAIVDRTIDVGFVREIRGESTLRYETVVREPFLALLPPAHPLASQGRLRPEALADQPFVHFARDVAPTLYDQIQDLCRSAGFAPRVVQEVREWLTHISLVEAGLGVALVPRSVRSLRWGAISYRSLYSTKPHAEIALCYQDEALSPAAETFLGIARSVLKASTSTKSM